MVSAAGSPPLQKEIQLQLHFPPVSILWQAALNAKGQAPPAGSWVSGGLGYIPDKGAYSYLFVYLINPPDFLEQGFHLIFGGDGNKRRVHFGPGVCSHSWFAGIAASAAYQVPPGEPPDAQLIKNILYPLGMCLVENYKNCFHHFFF